MLPQPSVGNSSIVFGMNLAFDPAKSPHYKVVCVRSSNSLESNELDTYSCSQIEIYSSETRTWRLSGDPFIAPNGTQYKNGVYCDGAIHWISSWGTSLYLNIYQEQLQEMPMPPIPEGWEEERRFRYFGESRDHLHLIEIYGPRTTQFNVYEMKRDYSNWFVKYCVDLDVVTTAFPEMIRSYLSPLDLHKYAFTILCIVREAHDGESYMVLHIPGKAIYYNLEDKTIKKMCDFAPDEANIEGIHIEGSIIFGWLNAFQYIGTLARV